MKRCTREEINFLRDSWRKVRERGREDRRIYLQVDAADD